MGGSGSLHRKRPNDLNKTFSFLSYSQIVIIRKVLLYYYCSKIAIITFSPQNNPVPTKTEIMKQTRIYETNESKIFTEVLVYDTVLPSEKIPLQFALHYHML